MFGAGATATLLGEGFRPARSASALPRMALTAA
jgi:hypothetical protein